MRLAKPRLAPGEVVGDGWACSQGRLSLPERAEEATVGWTAAEKSCMVRLWIRSCRSCCGDGIR